MSTLRADFAADVRYVNAVALKPLPYANPSAEVLSHHSGAESLRGGFSMPPRP